MNEERLPASLEVAGLRRLAEAEGGSAMVLASGDDRAGMLIVQLAERGELRMMVERQRDINGALRWQRCGPESLENHEISDYLARRRRIDPDIWLLELDVADSARFAAKNFEIC